MRTVLYSAYGDNMCTNVYNQISNCRSMVCYFLFRLCSERNQGPEVGVGDLPKVPKQVSHPLWQCHSSSPEGWAFTAWRASVIMGLEGSLSLTGPLPLKAASRVMDLVA